MILCMAVTDEIGGTASQFSCHLGILTGLMLVLQLVDVFVPHSQCTVAKGNVDVYAWFRQRESASLGTKFSFIIDFVFLYIDSECHKLSAYHFVSAFSSEISVYSLVCCDIRQLTYLERK